MKNFVLVPGDWSGAWIWEWVASGLRALGHHVHTVTLTGLDDPDADISDVNMDTHINDVLSILEERDLRDVIVVGQGCTGGIAGVVADRAPERVVHTVFVEASPPHDGRSALDSFPAGLRREEERIISENKGRWPTPDVTVVADGQDLTFEQAMWLVENFVGHPGLALSQPAAMTRPVAQQRGTYIVCEKEHFFDELAPDVAALRTEPTWTFHTLDTGLWPMVSAPDELVVLLDEAASQEG